MSAATAYLEVGRLALVAHHGESLIWHPSSVVLKRENGQAVLSELGKAIVSDESQSITFTGNFDEAYAVINTIDGSISSTGPAVTDVKSSTIPDAARGDLVIRDSVQYSVTAVQPDGVTSIVLILSKHGH